MPMFLHRYPVEKLPLYVATANIYGMQVTGEVMDECLDCREYKGASDLKPSFW
jgi:hypothetical protein